MTAACVVLSRGHTVGDFFPPVLMRAVTEAVDSPDAGDTPEHLCHLTPELQAWYMRTYGPMLRVPDEEQSEINRDVGCAVDAFRKYLKALALIIPADGD